MKTMWQIARERGGRAAVSRLRSLFEPLRTDGHVLMLHNGRSGSTLLGDMLDQHPDIFWDGETLEKRLHRRSMREGVGVDHLYGKIDPDEEFEALRHQMETRCGDRIFGTELQDYHLDMLGCSLRRFVKRLTDLGFSRFILLRRNYMRKVVSHLIATERETHHIAASQRVSIDPITINPERIYIGHKFTDLASVLRQYRRFEDAAVSAIPEDRLYTLSYEDHIQDNPQLAVRKVSNFLGVELHSPEVKFGKTTNAPLEDVIANYDEVAEYLRDEGLSNTLDGS